MNTLNGYCKSTLTNSSVLAAGGGDIPLGNTSGDVIPLNNGSVNVGLVAEKAVKDKKGSDIAETYLSKKTGGTTEGLIILGAKSYEKTIQWANKDFTDATAKAFMGTSGDWVVRSTYKVLDASGKKYTEEGWTPTYTTADLRFNRNSLKVGGANVVTSSNYKDYFGYIGKTRVQGSSAALSLEGINSIIPDASNTSIKYNLGSTDKFWSNLYVNDVNVSNNINLHNGLYWVDTKATGQLNPYKQILGKEGSKFRVGKDMQAYYLDLIGKEVTLYADGAAVLTARKGYININTEGYNGFHLQVLSGKVMADGYYLWDSSGANNKEWNFIMTNGTYKNISDIFSSVKISSTLETNLSLTLPGLNNPLTITSLYAKGMEIKEPSNEYLPVIVTKSNALHKTSVNINLGSISSSNLELNHDGLLKNYGGYIDFHFHNSNGDKVDKDGNVVTETVDYTSRIIENYAGLLSINSVTFKNGTFAAGAGTIASRLNVNHGFTIVINQTPREVFCVQSGYIELGKGFSTVPLWLNGSEYKFKMGSTVAMMLSTLGLLGIGDVGGAPREKLHVAGGNVLANSIKAYKGGFFINGDGNLEYFRIFRDQSTNALWILSSNYNGENNKGDLRISGINAAPLAKLVIYGPTIPSANNTYNLGTSDTCWQSAYLNYALHLHKSTTERWSIIRAKKSDTEDISRLHFLYYNSNYNNGNAKNVVYFDRDLLTTVIPISVGSTGGTWIQGLLDNKRAAINIRKGSNLNDYYPWIRQTGVAEDSNGNEIDYFVSQGYYLGLLCFTGAVATKTSNINDNDFKMNFLTGVLTASKGFSITGKTNDYAVLAGGGTIKLSDISSSCIKNENIPNFDTYIIIGNASTSQSLATNGGTYWLTPLLGDSEVMLKAQTSYNFPKYGTVEFDFSNISYTIGVLSGCTVLTTAPSVTNANPVKSLNPKFGAVIDGLYKYVDVGSGLVVSFSFDDARNPNKTLSMLSAPLLKWNSKVGNINTTSWYSIRTPDGKTTYYIKFSSLSGQISLKPAGSVTIRVHFKDKCIPTPLTLYKNGFVCISDSGNVTYSSDTLFFKRCGNVAFRINETSILKSSDGGKTWSV